MVKFAMMIPLLILLLFGLTFTAFYSVAAQDGYILETAENGNAGKP